MIIRAPVDKHLKPPALKMKVIAAVVLLGLTVAAQAQCPSYQFVVFKDSNRKASKLVKITENYKRALGFPNNANNMGPLANGHRQVTATAFKRR